MEDATATQKTQEENRINKHTYTHNNGSASSRESLPNSMTRPRFCFAKPMEGTNERW